MATTPDNLVAKLECFTLPGMQMTLVKTVVGGSTTTKVLAADSHSRFDGFYAATSAFLEEYSTKDGIKMMQENLTPEHYQLSARLVQP
ncbi:hypothetical protein [Burkholderia phage BCSR5]|nr:hypothetical protein [Burkholderia phage BCSR5]